MHGSVTARAEMAGRFARWANEHPQVWKARPVRGDIGIVFAPVEQELQQDRDALGHATLSGDPTAHGAFVNDGTAGRPFAG